MNLRFLSATGTLTGSKCMPRRDAGRMVIDCSPAAADAMRLRIERELHWECHIPDYLENVELT